MLKKLVLTALFAPSLLNSVSAGLSTTQPTTRMLRTAMQTPRKYRSVSF